jgi:MFS family permease
MWDKRRAYRFIFLMGLVSLLSDFTYEGAKGIIGPYLAYLGASAFAVSLISGASELIGYWIRLFSGVLSDRLRSYWALTMLGYALNLFSVPLLGLVKSWQLAGLLVFFERFGKGIRTPSRDVLLSKATSLVGHGKGFGLHEFLDQIGAVLGPLFVALVLLLGLGYRSAFLFLLIPAILAILLLFFAKRIYSDKINLEKSSYEPAKFSKAFYLYLLSSCLISLSFLPFPLIGFHLYQHAFDGWKVSLLFALAMALDALSALFFGVLYDKRGFLALAVGLSFGLFSPILLFLFDKVLFAIALWGISLGVQESIMRSAVAKLSSEASRGRAYGIFHFFIGLSAFLGGALMGLLYELSPMALVIYSLSLHILALFILLKIRP